MDGNIREQFDALHKVQHKMNDWLHFAFLDFDEESKTYCFCCLTEPWMCNPMGTLHGGISATILDHAMGSLAFCMVSEEGIAPASQIQVNYHRPLFAGKKILIKVSLVSRTRSLLHFSAVAYHEDLPDKICISGTGTYFIKPMATEHS